MDTRSQFDSTNESQLDIQGVIDMANDLELPSVEVITISVAEMETMIYEQTMEAIGDYLQGQQIAPQPPQERSEPYSAVLKRNAAGNVEIEIKAYGDDPAHAFLRAAAAFNAAQGEFPYMPVSKVE